MRTRVAAMLAIVVLMGLIVLVICGCDEEAKAGRFEISAQPLDGGTTRAVFLLDTVTGRTWMWDGEGWQPAAPPPQP